jgi:tryptophanyl-tRNA synthetase
VPDAYIPKVGAKIMSLSNPLKKMSKSDDDANSRIMLMDDADTVVRKLKRAVTDSGTEIRFDESRPAINNLLEIYHLITGKSAAEVEGHFAGKGYAQLKGDLAEATIEFLKPFQQRVREISDDELDQILERGREKASRIARATLQQVFERTGLTGSLKR